MKRFFFWSVVVTFVIAVAINFSAWSSSRGATATALFVAQNGYCFVDNGAGGFTPLKLTRPDCFGPFAGDHWCEGLGYTRCVYTTKKPATVEQPTATPAPTGGHATPPPSEPATATPSSGYANEPFGKWSEPGTCYSAGQKQFQLFSFANAEDCFNKLTDPQVCDYQNQCFTAERDLVDYLKGFEK